MKIWLTDSHKTISARSLPITTDERVVLNMARNSYESCQILLRAEKPFIIYGLEFSNINEVDFRYNFQENIKFVNKSYPDPLSNEKEYNVQANSTQSIWVTAFSHKKATAGEYQAKVTIKTSLGNYAQIIPVKIFNALIPSNSDAAFNLEYWQHTVNSYFRYPPSEHIDFIKYHYNVEKYSSQWWELNKHIALNLKENRCNVLFVRTLDLLFDAGIVLENGVYSFDWRLFDKWVNLYAEIADIKLFAGFQIIVQTLGNDVYTVLPDENGQLKITTSPIGSIEAENWLRQYLGELYKHLNEKGIANRWLQHIEDEPHESVSWKYGREAVKKYMPNVKSLEAIDNQVTMPNLQGNLDLWIPRIDIYEANRAFYDYRQRMGDSRWTYTCCLPNTKNYLNRFIGWDLLYSRLLFWGCFALGFTGFLHWGYNFWNPYDKTFGLNAEAEKLKGDGYIVYPDKKHLTVKNSIRAIAARDSAQDYELLKMLADKDPVKAYTIAKKVIKSFNKFTKSTAQFNIARLELLKALE